MGAVRMDASIQNWAGVQAMAAQEVMKGGGYFVGNWSKVPGRKC